MWIFTSKAFLSIVAPTINDPSIANAAKNHGIVNMASPDGTAFRNGLCRDSLLVRARRAGHIQAHFPGADVIRVNHRDYRYRALVPRADVAREFGKVAGAIRYTNFKDSIADHDLHDAAARVWGVMHAYQSSERDRPSLNRDFLDLPEGHGFTRAKSKPPVLRGNRGKGRR